MTMSRIRTLTLAIGAMIAAAAASQASAQITTASGHCGISSPSSGIIPTQFYDPFSPTAISNQTVTLTLDRWVGSVSQKTQQVDFYFTEPVGTPPGFQILYQGNNVLYTEGAGGLGVGAPPLSVSATAPTGTIGFNFGNSQDVFSPTVTISVPPGLDLSNGLNVTFTIVYACNGTGTSFNNVDATSPDTIANALILPVRVLSALQANYAGPAMDFGNVQGATSGTFTTFHAPTTGTSVINVKSSGPYTVDLTSANNYLLKDTSTDTIKYTLHFLGRDLTNAAPTFTTMNCARAGVITAKQLPLKGTLGEAANAKAVAGYSDTLTVTITPTNFGGATQTCETL
jgi:hypothetical protein